MRLLLISDTHGELATIDRLAAETGADAVVHAGDFGFYDATSTDRLTTRELMLRVRHSSLDQATRRRAGKMSRAELLAVIARDAPLSELPEYLEGRSFTVPVHAVWGNHEDADVIARLLDGTLSVGNLHLLAAGPPTAVGPFRLYGLGGNWLPGPRLLDAPVAGSGGKVHATLAEVGALIEAHDARTPDDGEVRVLVTHVSPGKEPLIARLAARIDAHLLVSGHMGSPYCAVWNAFAIREVREADRWLDGDVARVREACGASDDPRVRAGLSLLDAIPGERVRRGRGPAEPAWYRRGFAVNLPDAHDGHAILTLDDGRVGLQTVSAGLRP